MLSNFTPAGHELSWSPQALYHPLVIFAQWVALRYCACAVLNLILRDHRSKLASTDRRKFQILWRTRRKAAYAKVFQGTHDERGASAGRIAAVTHPLYGHSAELEVARQGLHYYHASVANPKVPPTPITYLGSRHTRTHAFCSLGALWTRCISNLLRRCTGRLQPGSRMGDRLAETCCQMSCLSTFPTTCTTCYSRVLS